MNDFIPPGYLTLDAALEHCGKRKHAGDWVAEKASSKEELQGLFFVESIPAELLIDSGNLISLPSRTWGSVAAGMVLLLQFRRRAV